MRIAALRIRREDPTVRAVSAHFPDVAFTLRLPVIALREEHPVAISGPAHTAERPLSGAEWNQLTAIGTIESRENEFGAGRSSWRRPDNLVPYRTQQRCETANRELVNVHIADASWKRGIGDHAEGLRYRSLPRAVCLGHR